MHFLKRPFLLRLSIKHSFFFFFFPLDFSIYAFFPMGLAGGATGKEPAANAENITDVGLIPRWGRSPGERHGNPLQYSCLENPYG